jgi:hypothetical protein
MRTKAFFVSLLILLLAAAAPAGIQTTGTTIEAWIAPTLGASWVNTGGAKQVAGYRKDSDGRVWIHGNIKNGTTTDGTVLFTLPAGYRPVGTENVMCNFYSPAVTKFISGTLLIQTNGEVQMFYVSDPTELSFTDISFSTN